MAQPHSVDDRRPDLVPPGRILVVGAANSGCQIALELSATRSVELVTAKSIGYPIDRLRLTGAAWPWRSSAIFALTVAAAIDVGLLPPAVVRRQRR